MESQFTISSILFIVLLIVPGVFFKRFYFQGHFTKQFGAGLFADRLITSVFWGFLIQILTFTIFSKTLNFSYNTIRKPLSKAYGEISNNSMPDFTPENLGYAFSYLLASIFIAGLLGTVLHRIVRFFKIDVKFKVFRFANQWHYYFKGDILSTNDFRNSRRGTVLSTSVDLVLDGCDGTTKMVSGFLTEYTISSKTGELETIYLTEAARFSTSIKGFKQIPGDCLIIPYSRVLDLNLRYTILAPNNYKIFWNNFVNTLALIGTLFILIYPWFLSLSALRISAGIITALIGWILMLAIVSPTSEAQSANKLKWSAILILAILSIAFVISAMFIFRIMH